MSSLPPFVSVVIPTLRRPKLLLRALESVFAQTYQQFEVIVVVDGPDDDSVAALRSVHDPRLQFFVNERSLTAAGARNFGVSQSKGVWIAFLDDDDEWLPSKLERQMALTQSPGPVLVTCLSKIITPLASYIWPREIFDNSRPLDDYLFDRQSVFAGSGFIQTSSYLIPRALCQKLPFGVDTPHDDWDFLLRLSKEFGVRIEMVPEVLVKVYFEEQRPSLSRTGSWAASLAWLDSIRPLLTRRAYSGFCLGVVGPRAANEGAYSAFFPLLLKAFRHGTPRLWHVLAFLAFWIVPQNLRRRLRASLSRGGARPHPSESPV
jgi:glycosyltransferase involved in cell wall biosynthesis